jgi:hypothetical protein
MKRVFSIGMILGRLAFSTLSDALGRHVIFCKIMCAYYYWDAYCCAAAMEKSVLLRNCGTNSGF